MLSQFFCPKHLNQPIVRVCLSKYCTNEFRKVCQNCWLQQHKTHLTDCVQECQLLSILEQEVITLTNLFQEIQIIKHTFPAKIQHVIEMIQNLKNRATQYILLFKEHDFVQFYGMVDFAKNCYNGLNEDVILNAIIDQFSIDEEKHFICKLKKVLDVVYGQINLNYLLEKLSQNGIKIIQLGNDLFASEKFYEAEVMFSVLLKEQIKREYLEKKYFSLLLQNKQQQAYEFCQQIGMQPEDLILSKSGLSAYQLYYQILSRSDNQLIKRNEMPMRLLYASTLLYSKNYAGCQNILNTIIQELPENEYVIELYTQNLIEQGLYDDALQFCDNGLQKYPRNTGYIRGKCQCLIRNQKGSKEIPNIDETDSWQLLMKAQLLMQQNKNNEALQVLSMIPSDEPIYQVTQFLQGCLLIGEKQFDEGLQQLENVNFNQNDPYRFGLHIAKLVAQNKYDEAQKLVEGKIDQWPRSKYLWVAKSAILVKLNKIDEAVECLEITLSFYPDDSVLKYIFACLLSQIRKYDQALIIIEEVLLHSETLNALELKAKLLCWKEQYQEALKCFKKICDQYTNHTIGHFGAGFALLCLKDFKGAVIHFDKLIQLDNNNFPAIYNRGMHELKQGIALSMLLQYEEARENFGYIINYKESRVYYIHCLEKTNRSVEALEEIQKLSDEYSANEYVLRMKCRLLIANDKYEEANQLFQQINIQYFTPPTLHLRSNIQIYQVFTLIQLNQYLQALELIEKTILIDNQDQVVLLLKGFLLEQQQKLEQALDCYKKSLKLQNQPQTYRALIAILKKMQRNEEALKLKEQFLNLFPDKDLNLDVKKSLQLNLVIKSDFKYHYDQGDVTFFEYNIMQLVALLQVDSESMQVFW